ncbi:hypothetical protein HMPREF9144_2326 [Prevotella pallens ATCC 700821]|uniref:Uncharacterized protein n=1 Tax=Prevotella pallens ATCC 700821 TaxID=997353 RepID=F9DKY4_9BACT|nr:hypothetical protein HMPREF9144_2326 [Prevotella pallens ATCC 700821]
MFILNKIEHLRYLEKTAKYSYFLFRYLSRLFQISVSNVSDICQ